MENSFDKAMAKRTNEELVKIVTTESSKYQPLAIESAKKEIELRHINITKFEEIAEKVNIEKQTQDKFKASVVPSNIRFAHLVIDFFSFVIVYSFLFGLTSLFFTINSNKTSFLILFLLLLSFFLNYAFMEYKFQKTTGKFITKTKVVGLNGEKPKLDDIMARTALRLLPFDGLSFFFAKNGFHDGLSNTRVVRD